MNSYRKVPETAGTSESIINKILPDDFIAYLKSLLGLHKKNNGTQPSFQSVFGSYRKVLESGNKAIGIISDMNNRLGGDSCTDITYAKDTYSELHHAVETAMENFDIFTQCNYMNLHDIFSRINWQINQAIDGVISVDLPEHAHSPSAELINMRTNDKDKNILRYIAPLNLVDPMFDDFTPEGCKTIHDIIRFMHVMSVRQLAKSAARNQHSVPEHFLPALR